jgi:hypothetical protein
MNSTFCRYRITKVPAVIPSGIRRSHGTHHDAYTRQCAHSVPAVKGGFFAG